MIISFKFYVENLNSYSLDFYIAQITDVIDITEKMTHQFREHLYEFKNSYRHNS